ncbi:centromere-associated protein E isoform X3 [Vanacampus margaritifer]
MAEESAVKVFVRLRPFIEREECASSEKKEPVQVFWKTDKKLIHQIDDGSSTKCFTFDRVFTPEETTNQLYQDIAKPLVVSTVEGYNGTIFAYGQTSSGKTFTMMGSDHVPGVIPLAVDNVFETIKKCPKKEFLLRVSYLEIYNETVTDLLVDKWRRKPLEVRETINKTIYVADLTEELVTSSAQVLAWIRKGEKNRHYGKTEMNQRSSRSHTVFRMILESRERTDLASGENADGAIIVSHLNLVDLAGSERASQTGAEGTRLKEGCNINRSLFTLGQVIKKLGEESQRNFINYRDSKLTRILQNSLGGNAKTVILCTITTASLDETLRTLQFASTAKKMKNDPHVTEVSDDGALLKRYRNEIVDLKRRLQEVSSETQTTVTEKEVLAQLLQEKHQLQVDQEDRIKNLTKLLVTSNNLTRVQKVPKRRVTWGGKMLRLAHSSASEDGPSARNIADSFSLKRKADFSCVMELGEEDEDFCGSWEIPDETSEDSSENQEFSIRSFGNRSAERISELELQLETVGQQKQQALDQILAMEEKAAEVDLRLKSEAQQKAEAMEKIETLELSMAELKRQLEEKNDNQSKSDQQLEIDLAEIVQRFEILATEKDMMESERDYLKQDLGVAMEKTQILAKENAALAQEVKERVELEEFVSLEEKFRNTNEIEMQNKISSLEKAVDSRELQYLELEKYLENLSEELKKKTKIADDLQDMCGKDLAEEVSKLRLSLDDAEVLGRETKKEWAVLRSENIALEELKTTLSLSHEKMEAEVDTLRLQLEAEKCKFRKMQADLQKELNVVFSENMKLMSLLDGKVPRNIMDSVELERTVTNLKTELSASQEAEGILRAQLEELRSLQAPPYEVNNLEEQISAEEMEKQESVVAMLTAERDQLRMDLQENIDMTIENQEELRTALARIGTLKQQLKELEDSRTSNLGKSFDDMTAELETLQIQKEQLQATLQEVSDHNKKLEAEQQQFIDKAAENQSLLQSLQSQLQEQVQRNDDIERNGLERQAQLEHQVEESQNLLQSLQDEFEELKQSNCNLVKVTEEECDLKQSKTECQAELMMAQEKIGLLQEEVNLFVNENRYAGESKNQIQKLAEELECVTAERDNTQSEMEKLVCQVTSLSEERDQLHDQLEVLRQETSQLRAELELMAGTHRLEKTECQAELMMAQEKIGLLQEEVNLLMNENRYAGESKNQRLAEELECVTAERDNTQSEMEKLVCQVTSLGEERDQLHDQLEVLRQETSQLRAELELMAGTHRLEVKESQNILQSLQDEIEELKQNNCNLVQVSEKEFDLKESIQALTEELECVTAERDNTQSEMEKLVCQVTSLSEERDQLHDQLEVLRQETSQLRAQLELMAETHSLELQQLKEQLKTFKENETVAQAEAVASQQLLVEPNASISVANEKLRSCDWDLMVSGVTASSRLHDLTLRLQELFGRFQQFIDKASQPHAAFQRGALVVECFLNDDDYGSFPQDTRKAHNVVCELGLKNLRTLQNIHNSVVGKAKLYKKFFQELVRIDVCVFKEWCSQDVLRCRASSPKDVHCRTDQEHRLDELLKKRQLYVQKMGDFLENLGAGLHSYRSEVSAEVRERSRFFKQVQDEHDRPPLVVSRLHRIFSAEIDRRSAMMQSRERILQGIFDERNVRCEELQQLNAQAQFQLEEEKSKCADLQQKLGEAPARSELTVLCNNQQLLRQSEEKVKVLWLKNKMLEEAQRKGSSYKMADQQHEAQLRAQVEEQKHNIKTLKNQLQESENKKLEEAQQESNSYKMVLQQLETQLLESRAQLEEQKNDIKILKGRLQESEKRESPSAADLQKAQARLYMKEMELSVAYDKHQQEIQRMTTVLHAKEASVRTLKESLRTLQQQGEISFLQGEELHERLVNPRGLNKHSAVLQKSALEEEVKRLQTQIAQLENVISSLQADVSKWKNRAIKLKSKAKENVQSALPCTPTKHGLPVCPDFFPQSPKKSAFAPLKVKDSPKTTLLDSPRVPLLDSPKSKFFDKAANDDILSRTFPRLFFDNSSLGISADVSGVPDGESADTNANSAGCQSQPLDGPETCITQ